MLYHRSWETSGNHQLCRYHGGIEPKGRYLFRPTPTRDGRRARRIQRDFGTDTIRRSLPYLQEAFCANDWRHRQCRECARHAHGKNPPLPPPNAFIPRSSFTKLAKVSCLSPTFLDLYIYVLIRLTGGIILQLTYGIDVREEGNDPFVDLIEKANTNFNASTIPGAFPVDFFPILRSLPEWLPGMGFLETARRWFQDTLAMVEVPYNYTKDQMVTSLHHRLRMSFHQSSIGQRQCAGVICVDRARGRRRHDPGADP